jgi:hypothetical protein
MITLAGQAKERGSAGITVVITDSAGVAVTPTALTYRLTTEAGVELTSGTVDPLDESMLIVLSGAALRILADEAGRRLVPRLLALEGTYDDSRLGAASPYTEQLRFVVESIAGVS